MSRVVRASWLAVLVAAVSAVVGRAQAPAAAGGPGWVWAEAPFAELWFHGLARVGFQGPGPVPLYDPEVPRLFGEGHGWAGPASPLSLRAERLRRAFEADPAFEILHFVPLYFGASGLDETMGALRALSERAYGAPEVRPALAFGVNVLAAGLQRPGQRRLLGEFVEVLSATWDSGFGAAWEASSDARVRRVTSLQEAWDRLEPSVQDVLDAWNVSGGVVLTASALGPEGRFFQGDAGRNDDNLVVVRAPALDRDDDESTAAAVTAAVRELCFVAVRRAFPRVAERFATRLEASRASDRAATHCGAWLLEARAPHLLDAYRVRFGDLGAPRAHELDAPYGALIEALELELIRSSETHDRSALPDLDARR